MKLTVCEHVRTQPQDQNWVTVEYKDFSALECDFRAAALRTYSHKDNAEGDAAPLWITAVYADDAESKAGEYITDIMPPLLFLDLEGLHFPDFESLRTWAFETFASERFFLYSSFSNGAPGKGGRGRIVIELSRETTRDEASLLRKYFVTGTEGFSDQVCADIQRGFYGPGGSPTSPGLFFSNPGAPLDVDTCLEEARGAGLEAQQVHESGTIPATLVLTRMHLLTAARNLAERMERSPATAESDAAHAAFRFIVSLCLGQQWGDPGATGECAPARLQGTSELARAYPEAIPESLADLIGSACDGMPKGFEVGDIVRAFRGALEKEAGK